MKNLLTTLMVLMIVTVAGAALAGDMDWKFYGKLHTSIDYLDNGTDSGLYMASNTSRFGFKGGTELQENLSFIWQFENSVNMAQKEGFGLADRNTYLGFKGEFGKIIYGIHDTPFKTLGRKVDLFKDEMGDLRQTTMGWDRRMQDVVAWVSPDWSGFGIFGAYQLNQESTLGDDTMTAYSLMASYSKDAFFVGAAVEGLSETYSAVQDEFAEDLVYGDAPMGIRLAAKYDAEKFAVTALYQNISNWEGEWNGTEWDGWDTNTFGLGALFRAGDKWGIKGQYYMVNPFTDAEDDAGTTAIDESDVNGNLIALGVDHYMSKSVRVYFQWAMMGNGENAGFGLGGTTIDGDRMFNNGHGTYVDPSYDDDGKPKNPMGFSVGSVIKF